MVDCMHIGEVDSRDAPPRRLTGAAITEEARHSGGELP